MHLHSQRWLDTPILEGIGEALAEFLRFLQAQIVEIREDAEEDILQSTINAKKDAFAIWGTRNIQQRIKWMDDDLKSSASLHEYDAGFVDHICGLRAALLEIRDRLQSNTAVAAAATHQPRLQSANGWARDVAAPNDSNTAVAAAAAAPAAAATAPAAAATRQPRLQSPNGWAGDVAAPIDSNTAVAAAAAAPAAAAVAPAAATLQPRPQSSKGWARDVAAPIDSNTAAAATAAAAPAAVAVALQTSPKLAGLLFKPASWRPPEPSKLASLLSKPTSWQPPEPGKLAGLLSKLTSWQPPEPSKLADLLFKSVSWQPPGPGKLASLHFETTSWQPPGCKLTGLIFNPTSWQPPGSCKLTKLLFKPTNDTHTSGQAVFKKDKLFITPESPGVSAHAGLRDSSEHARAWVSFKEGVG